MKTILCTNGMLSKTLAVVRSLGSRNIKVIVSEKTRWHVSGMSKYCAKTVLSPDPSDQPDRYKDWLFDVIRREKCDMLFPMDDDTMTITIENYGELLKLCKLIVPPRESYEKALDKAETIKIAKLAGVSCPATIETFHLGDHPNKEELLKWIGQLSVPIVIKPRFSSGARGIRIVNQEDQIWEAFQEVHRHYPYPVIQEYIPPGDKYDICLCYDARHQLKAAYAQKQIRNYPIQKGPSTVHESVHAPELIELAQRLFMHIPWNGVADIEFMIDPRNGQPMLMEINPRFWSSLHLSIRSGVDFPWIMYQIMEGNDVPPTEEYILGKRGRALLPGDILHFLSSPDRWKMNPPVWTTKLPDDTISMNDPLPTLGFFLSALRYSLDSKIWKFVIRR